MEKIILSADSTCDLDAGLRERYGVNCCPLHIILDHKDYLDGVNITADDIYDVYDKYRILPKTAAPNPEEYIRYFKKWTDEGYEVIHLSLGSGLSSSYQNCCIAARELKNVYPVDSYNLSLGIGLLVIEAAELIAKGMTAAQIQQELNRLRFKSHSSFVINSLTYLYAGGRCSALAALGSNMLGIKPCIEVDNTSGKMKVGKKYRGSFSRVLKNYAVDKLKDRTDLKDDRIFIAHSGISPETIDLVRSIVEDIYHFEEVFIMRAGCTISSHCGPDTVGLFFMTR